MKYLLQIYDGGAIADFWRLPADQRDAIIGEYSALTEAPGVLGAEQLQPVETATTVRVDRGQMLLSDGPFIEAKEYVGGFYLVEAEGLDEALEIAARIPAARMGGAVEVRPVLER